MTDTLRPLSAAPPAAAPPDGFEAFYTAQWPDLFAFAATLTAGDLVAAEEITQESMVRVFARWSRLEDPRPYTFRVAANLVRRRWSHAVREPLWDPAQLPERAAADRADHTLDAVRRLPDRLRSVVVLHYYADLPVQAVAAALHRPTGTVKRRLHEARARLAETLEETR